MLSRIMSQDETVPASGGGFDAQLPQSFFTPAPALAASRYNRQLLIPDISLAGQERISSTKVLVIGLGGLGSPASLYLAGAGVHTLGLLDHDVVEESNLHRQIVHRESSVHPHIPLSSVSQLDNGRQSTASMTKVQSALRGCQDLNSSITYRTHEVQLNGSNALDIVQDYDIVLDCTDNPATRYLISDVCVILDKVLVSGAAQKLDGQLMVLNYVVHPEKAPPASQVPLSNTAQLNEQVVSNISQQLEKTAVEEPLASPKRERGPCYRCVFPVPPSPEMVQGCSEIGILGPVVGMVGCLMATEAIRLICRPEEVRKPSMLLYNAWSPDPRAMFRTIGLKGRRSDCVTCGDEEKIQAKNKQKIVEASIRSGLMDYEQFCGRVEDVHILSDEERMTADEFMTHVSKSNRATIIDVREEFEVELGPKIANSISIPISKITRSSPATSYDRNGSAAEDIFAAALQNSHTNRIIFVCRRGNDSQIAARKLIERNQSVKDSPWIGDVKGGLMEVEKLARDM